MCVRQGDTSCGEGAHERKRDNLTPFTVCYLRSNLPFEVDVLRLISDE